jgi:hypothetical protein
VPPVAGSIADKPQLFTSSLPPLALTVPVKSPKAQWSLYKYVPPSCHCTVPCSENTAFNIFRGSQNKQRLFPSTSPDRGFLITDTECVYFAVRAESLYVCLNFATHTFICGPGSSVGIATGYGMDGPWIESRWGRDFPHLSRPALGPKQPPVQWVPGLSRGIKQRGVTLTPHTLLVLRSKIRVELYLYSPSEPSWPVKRVKPTYTFISYRFDSVQHTKSHTTQLIRLLIRVQSLHSCHISNQSLPLYINVRSTSKSQLQFPSGHNTVTTNISRDQKSRKLRRAPQQPGTVPPRFTTQLSFPFFTVFSA